MEIPRIFNSMEVNNITTEELNTELYKKVFEEQGRYCDELLRMTAPEILEHAYAYTIHEDILISLEYNNLTDAQCRALLKDDKPLERIFSEWENSESPHMECIQNMIEHTANEQIRLNSSKQRCNESR